MGSVSQESDPYAFLMQPDDDLDFIDIIAYQMVSVINAWFNPVDRLSERKRFFASLS